MMTPLSTNEEVIYWFQLVQQAFEAGQQDTDTTQFAARVRAAGAPFDVEEFLRALETLGDGIRPVARMLEYMPQVPTVYWELYWQRHPQADTAATDDRFGWLTESQRTRLTTAWGAQWRFYLGEQLDYRWGHGWETHPAEHKWQWLDDLLVELLAPVPDATHGAGDDEADFEAVVAELVEQAVARMPGAELLSQEELIQVTAQVRQKLREEMSRE